MNLQNPWLKYGLISGLASIATSITFFYLIDMGIFKQSMIGFGLMILFMVLAGLEYRRTHDNIMLYGEAFKVTFLTAFIGMLISFAFSNILFHLIDPGLVDVVVEKTIESTRSFMVSVGAPDDQVEEAIEKMEEEMPEGFSPLGQLQSLFSSSVVSAILAAIVSIFLKKDEKPI